MTLTNLGRLTWTCAIVVTLANVTWGADNVRRDIEFAKVGDVSLRLDFYPPEPAHAKASLLIYVHGGAWRAGDKADVPIRHFTQRGYAIASVNYRLTTVAPFPANVHDIKAAIRYLRAEAERLDVDPRRFAIVGSSAGGHLAALVGVSNGVKELEGTVGAHLETSSDVQAIVSYYGASNLQSILDQSTEFGLTVRVPALQLLLGGQPKEKPELARLASPVAHIDAHDPPLFLMHGDQDPQMPPAQSREFQAAYTQANRPVELVMIPNAVHGGGVFYDAAHTQKVEQFLKANLPP